MACHSGRKQPALMGLPCPARLLPSTCRPGAGQCNAWGHSRGLQRWAELAAGVHEREIVMAARLSRFASLPSRPSLKVVAQALTKWARTPVARRAQVGHWAGALICHPAHAGKLPGRYCCTCDACIAIAADFTPASYTTLRSTRSLFLSQW